MSTGMRDKHLQRRIQGLSSTDPQFADARPDNEIIVAITRPGLQLAQIAAIEMEGMQTGLRSGSVRCSSSTILAPVAPWPSCCPDLTPLPTANYGTARALRPPRWRTSRCGRVIECVRSGFQRRRLRRHRPGADSSRRSVGSAANEHTGRAAATHRRRAQAVGHRLQH